MKDKLIKDKSDKKQAIILVTGIVALASLVGGNRPTNNDKFLKGCKKLATKYIDMLVKVETE